ncbi:hypothetical protein HFD88_006627 [Aspergillus terreus]|nr:hypothetical protein HFD88_006627 [Aspergillus terreus]
MVGEKSGTLESSEATPLLHTAVPIVSAQECLQHQHLLRCFVNLKQTISRKKGLFRTEHVHDINTEPDPRTRQTIVEERRWSIYVSRAIHRFSVWWACLATLRTPGFLSGQATEKPYWTTDRMPPLDVLMVLHALTLHSKAFGEDCLRHHKMALWMEGFPLQLVSQCIDRGDFTYTCAESAKVHFEETTKLAWDNLADPDDVAIECFRCRQPTRVPWTTRRQKGLADDKFNQQCQSCKFILRRDGLLVQKLRRDLHLLLEGDTPLPGTCRFVGDDGTVAPNNAANELLKQSLVMLLLEETRPSNLFPDMTEIVETSRQAVGEQSLPMLHDVFERYQYTANSSCDLHAAVMRVTRVASAMQNVDWSEDDLYGPLLGTRYVRFLREQSKGFKDPAVDSRNGGIVALVLVWSTHQLATRSYCAFSRRASNGMLVDWEPAHDSTACDLCHTLHPPSFARRFIRGLMSVSVWKDFLSSY